MSTLKLKALKASVLKAQKANMKMINEAAEIAALDAILKLENNKDLFEAKVKLAVIGGNTNTLQKLVDECSGIIDAMPVENIKTKATRIWAGSRRFTFGTQIDLMFQLASGILYSCAEHKQLLLAHTGLDAELLEQFMTAFGSPAYYSRNFNTLVEAKLYNVDDVKSAVTVMQSALCVVVDTSQLTEEKFAEEFSKGGVRAHEDKLKADEAIAEAGNLVL